MSTATAIGPNISNGGKRIIDATIPYRVEVEIQGEADLLFHRWNCEAVEAKARSAKDVLSESCTPLKSCLPMLRAARGFKWPLGARSSKSPRSTPVHKTSASST